MSELRSAFEIVSDDVHAIVIRDIGHDQRYMSVTNDIDNVVAVLHARGMLQGSKRLRYYDSEDQLTEVFHDGQGRFTGFGFIS